MDQNNKQTIDVLLVNYGRVNKVGIFTLASYAREKSLNVRIIDGNYSSILSEFKKLNDNYNILSAGFTATTDVIEPVKELASEFKKINSKIYLILGGYHGTILPEDTLNNSNFDIVVVREGEITLVEIVKSLQQGAYPTTAIGCFEKVDNKVVFNEYRPLIEKLDELPYPAYDLVEMKRYFHGIRLENNLKRVVVLLISRGCPFDCVFCGSKNMWCRKFRMHSVDYVISMIKWLINEHNIDGISFLDDELVTNKKYINELCDRLIAEGLNKKIKWSCHGRVSSVDEEILKKMKLAGCVLIRFGIESGSEKMLAYLKNKSVKVSQSYEAIKMCKKVGLPSFGSFIVGSPDETIDDLVSTIEFITLSGLTYADAFNMVPYPGTDIHDYAIKNNLIKQGIGWKDYQIEGENCHPILRSHNFDFKTIDHIKSYINLNIVYPLNYNFSIKKLNHKKELEKVIAGDLSKTEFSSKGIRKMKTMKLMDKIKRALKNPKLSIQRLIKNRLSKDKLLSVIKTNYPIILIVILAFVLRIWGITYGLPGLFVGDEKSLVGGTLKMMYQKNPLPVLDPDVFRLLYYPTLIPWTFLIFFIPWAIFVYLTGNFSGLSEIRDYFTLNPESFFLIARIISVFFATAIVYLIYKVATQIFSKRVGLFSALLYAVSWLPIHQGHFAKHWNFGAFFGLLALYYGFLLLKKPSKKNYIITGIVIGLAGFADYIFAIYGLIIAAIHFFFLKSSWKDKLLDKKFWLLLFLSLFIFGIGIITYPQEFWRLGFGEDSTATAAKNLSDFFLVVRDTFSTLYHLETLIFVLSIIGGVFLFFKRRKVFWLLLLIPFIFPFLYYFLLHFEARYVLLFLPFLTILAGYGLGQMLNLLKIKSNLVIIVIVLALIFIPLKNAVIFDKLLSQTDTRILAKNWIENNLSYGSKIIINSSEFNLIKSADCIYNQQQTRNLSLRSRDYIMWDQDRPESYCVWPLDLTQVLPSNVNEYEYYLTDAYTIRRTRHLGEELTPRLELIKEFQGSPHVLVETWPNRFVHDILRVKKTGPTVKIYRLK